MELLSDDPRTEDIHCAYVVCCSERGIIQQVLSSWLPVMQRRRYLQMTFPILYTCILFDREHI